MNSTKPQLRQGPVTFDRQSFLVGGQRVWLHAAEIHYFRHPCELWRETLERAKAAGINTISTYVAWNFHCPAGAVGDFTGDRDLGRFLDLCAELGLYVVARPGPYICSEWDGGGMPAWVLGKPGIRTRDNDPVFMADVTDWFRQLLPLLAVRQVSRGGPVILVQNENEFHGGWNDSTRQYIRALNLLFREAGIDVPIIACNAHGYTPTTVMINYSIAAEDQILWPDMVVTYNWGPGAEPLRDLRQKQPAAPLFMTEYWAGPQVFWGKPLSDWCATPEYARSMLEFASLGCQVTYYMFDGGTNFGYWAGSNIVTSYQSNYPVREGGILWDKYYKLKPVNHFITQFGDFLAASDEVVDGSAVVPAPAGARVILRQGPGGRLLFLSDAGARPVVALGLPDGSELTVPLPTIRGLVLPWGFDVLPGVRLDFAALGLLGLSAVAQTVVLWGVAGTRARLSINGRERAVTVPADRAARLKVGKATILIVSEALAGRSWFLGDGRIVIGADFATLAGDGTVSVRGSDATPGVEMVGVKGRAARVTLPAMPPRPALPALGPWQVARCPEVAGNGEGWQALPAGPATHEALGRMLGYVWYRAEFTADEEGVLPLCTPLLSTRLSVYANGSYCGTTGELTRHVEFCGYRHPADALQQEQVLVPLRRGRNVLVLLSDHLGRSFVGYPDPQGLQGPVYLGARRVSLTPATSFASAPLSEVAFRALYHKGFREPAPLPGADFALTVPPDHDAYLTLPAGWRNLVVSVDGEHVTSLPQTAAPHSVVRLPAGTAGRSVVLRLQGQGPAGSPEFAQVHVFLADRAQALLNWAWKAGGDWPAGVDGDEAAAVLQAGGESERWSGLVPEQKQASGGTDTGPAYCCTTFAWSTSEPAPLFLNIGKLHKGQLFLNGRNLGRFWQVGGHWQGNGVQDRYYLPRPWLRENNTLVIFEEHGLPPDGVALVWGEPGNRVTVTC